MKRFEATFGRIWDKSPSEVWVAGRRRARRLIGKPDLGWNYSLEAVLANPKHMDPTMELERWERHWRVCRLHGMGHLETDFAFAGKNVFELGCGPVLGIGPTAIFHGAERFWYREPDLVRQALESKQIKERYFVPAYEELAANYGRKINFDDWYGRVIELSQPLPAGAEQLVDITVSNSVLEHISFDDLLIVLRDLYTASRPGAWYSHTVDFGPHGGRLCNVYAKDRNDKPRHLNYLRKSEIASMLNSSGCEVSSSVLYKVDEIRREAVHETWKTYAVEDLAARVVIFLGNRLITPVKVD